jgi:hypothetical protein
MAQEKISSSLIFRRCVRSGRVVAGSSGGRGGGDSGQELVGEAGDETDSVVCELRRI